MSTIKTTTAMQGKVTVTTWNVNYDWRSAKPEWVAFDWPARRSAVIDTILKFGSDFVCLQELRKENVTDLLGDRRLGEIYDMAYGRTNATDMAFCLMTMWNKKRWSCHQTETMWFGDNSMSRNWTTCPGNNGFGRIVFTTTFHTAASPDPKSGPTTVATNEPTFCVCNVHFGLSETERMHEARLLNSHLDHQADLGSKWIIACGDFNSFPDAGGADEVRAMQEGKRCLVSAAAPYGSPISTLSGIDVAGTQIAYPYDSFVKFKGTDHEEIHPRDGEMGGHLDHVFSSHDNLALIECKLLTYKFDGSVADEKDLAFCSSDKAPRFPSDHLPMFVEFKFI